MVLAITISMLLVVRPFKDNASSLNYLTTMIMFLLALGHAAAIGINMAGKAFSQTIFMGILFLVVFLTLLYIPVIVIHQAYNEGVFKKLFTLRRHGYALLERQCPAAINLGNTSDLTSHSFFPLFMLDSKQ